MHWLLWLGLFLGVLAAVAAAIVVYGSWRKVNRL